MRYIPAIVAAATLALASVAFAGEFKDECAWGLANGKHVKTDCKIHSEIDGKTYCFSSADAQKSFMKDKKMHAKKAAENFGRT